MGLQIAHILYEFRKQPPVRDKDPRKLKFRSEIVSIGFSAEGY